MKNARMKYAYRYVNETGMLASAPTVTDKHIDYEAFAGDFLLEGYTKVGGYLLADY